MAIPTGDDKAANKKREAELLKAKLKQKLVDESILRTLKYQGEAYGIISDDIASTLQASIALRIENSKHLSLTQALGKALASNSKYSKQAVANNSAAVAASKLQSILASKQYEQLKKEILLKKKGIEFNQELIDIYAAREDFEKGFNVNSDKEFAGLVDRITATGKLDNLTSKASNDLLQSLQDQTSELDVQSSALRDLQSELSDINEAYDANTASIKLQNDAQAELDKTNKINYQNKLASLTTELENSKREFDKLNNAKKKDPLRALELGIKKEQAFDALTEFTKNNKPPGTTSTTTVDNVGAVLEAKKKALQDQEAIITAKIADAHNKIAKALNITVAESEKENVLAAVAYTIGTKTYDQVIESTKAQMQVNKLLEFKNGLHSNIAELVGEEGERVLKLGKLIKNALVSPLALVGALLAIAIKSFIDIGEITKSFLSTTKLTVDQTEHLREQAHDLSVSLRDQGVSMEKAYEAQEGLIAIYGTTNRLSDRLVENTVLLQKAYGLAGANAAGVTYQLQKTTGISAEVAGSIAAIGANLAQVAGVAPDLVFQDIAQSSEAIATYFKGTASDLLRTGVEARRLGLTIQQIADVSKTLLTFESSIEDQMTASVLLGRQINLDKARELALSGDILGATKETMNQIGSLADFNRLNAVQKDAIAKAAGMTTGELQQSLEKQQQLNNMTSKQKAEYAANLALLKSQSQITGDKLLKDQKNQLVQEKLKDALEKIEHVLANVLLPILEPILDLFGDILSVVGFILTPITLIAKGLHAIAPVLKVIIGLLGAVKLASMAINSQFVTLRGGIFKTLISPLKLAISLIGTVGKGLFTALTSPFKTFGSLITTAGSALKKLGSSKFADFILSRKPKVEVPTAGKTSAGSLSKDVISKYKDLRSQGIKPADALKQAKTIDKKPSIINKITDFVKGKLGIDLKQNREVDAGSKLVADKIDELKDVMSNNNSTIKSTIKDKVTNIKEKVKESFTGSTKTEPNVKGDITDKVKSVSKLNMSNVLKGAGAILILSGSIFVAAKAFQQFATVKWKDVVLGLGAISGLATIAMILSKAKGPIIEGAVAIGILSLALIPAAFAFSLLEKIDTKSIFAFSTAIVGLSLAAAGLSAIAPFIVTGALAIGALGLALIPVGLALKIVAPAIKTLSISLQDLVTKVNPIALGTLGVSIISLSAGLGTLAMTGLFTIPAIAGLSVALSGFGLGLMMINENVTGLASVSTLLTGLTEGAHTEELYGIAGGLLAIAGGISAVSIAGLAALPILGVLAALAPALQSISNTPVKNTESSANIKNESKSNTSTTKEVETDNTAILDKLDQLIKAVTAGGDIKLDGTKVGEVLAIKTARNYKISN